jgi:hypothetical protein
MKNLILLFAVCVFSFGINASPPTPVTPEPQDTVLMKSFQVTPVEMTFVCYEVLTAPAELITFTFSNPIEGCSELAFVDCPVPVGWRSNESNSSLHDSYSNKTANAPLIQLYNHSSGGLPYSCNG